MAVILITGGTGDLGLALAHRLAARGDVAVIGGRDEQRAAAVASGVVGAGAVVLDVTDPASCDRAVAAVVDRHGRLDGVACCAATFAFDGALDVTAAAFEAMLRVNVTGSLLPCQAAARVMMAAGSGGSMVLFSSSAAQRAVGAPAYAASKGAVEALARELALAWAPHGIRVNAVSPGLIESRMSRPAIADPETLGHFMRHTPLGRPGQPHEVAAAAAFLLDGEAGYVTASVIPADGGFLAR